MRGSLELHQGISKVDILKRILSSTEATRLYMIPLQIPNQENCTISDMVRTFYTSHPISFIRSSYMKICGYEPPEINGQLIALVFQGMRARTLLLARLIEEKYSEKAITGYYPTIWNWIATEKKNIQQVHFFYGKEQIDQTIIPEQFVVDLPNGGFWGKHSGAVMTSEHKIIVDVSREFFTYSVYANEKVPNPECKEGNIAVLHSFISTNYFHFMFDVAARIHLLRKSNIPIDGYIIDTSLPFQEEILSLLGIEKEKRIPFHDTLCLKANHLIIPSYIIVKGMMPKWACDFLRRELLLNRKVEKIHGYERIYISREKAQRRKVKNEDEVMELLKPYGFKCVFLESEPLTRKIELFHSAQVIVAPHGAGLTHLIFCNPGTKVIEFFNPAWMRQSFRLISQYLGLDYYSFLGKESSSPYEVNDYRRLGDDIFVEKEKLIHALKEVFK